MLPLPMYIPLRLADACVAPFMGPAVVKARNHTLAPRQIELGVCQAYAAVLADPSFEWQI